MIVWVRAVQRILLFEFGEVRPCHNVHPFVSISTHCISEHCSVHYVALLRIRPEAYRCRFGRNDSADASHVADLITARLRALAHHWSFHFAMQSDCKFCYSSADASVRLRLC